jgi:endonuclease/exonuclease/phosphatase (EEP) superfamily protein YafD
VTLGAYEASSRASSRRSQHDGPIILAGDLNTWTDDRVAALQTSRRSWA